MIRVHRPVGIGILMWWAVPLTCVIHKGYVRQNSERFKGVLLFSFLSFLAMFGNSSAARGESASELIQFLTFQTNRPDKQTALSGLSGCGHFQADRAAARSLWKLGNSAIPEIEPELDLIDANGDRSEFSVNAGWLLDAYAGIKGSSAYPRLSRMILNPKVDSSGRKSIEQFRSHFRSPLTYPVHVDL